MKIENQVLSIEQMKHLQELDVDTSDASMCWVAGEDADEEDKDTGHDGADGPKQNGGSSRRART